MTKLTMTLALMFGLSPSVFADESFPNPIGWDANLENAKVYDVISESSPDSALIQETETKFKAALKAKGLLYPKGQGHFAILSPSVTCRAPYQNPNAPQVCQVSLTLREHIPHPPTANPEGKRTPWGIVGTYHSRFYTTFADDKETLSKALDVLFKHFLETLERKPKP